MNAPLIRRPIALVGLPGAGKSIVGALLAKRSALPFFDSDAEIERESEETIASLFAVQGESYFRDLERATIDRLLGEAPLILATGGGAMAQAPTRRMLLSRSTTIWLDAPTAVLAARLEDLADRPLLVGNLAERLEALWTERQTCYRTAAYRIDAAPPPDVVVARILDVLAG